MAKFGKTKYKPIVLSDFKTDVPTIMGGLGEWKQTGTPLKAIYTPELWNSCDCLRGAFPRASKYLQDQRIKLQYGINR